MAHKDKWSRQEAADLANIVLKAVKSFKLYKVCGSYRRGCETVGDLDIVIVPESRRLFMASVNSFASEIIASGGRKLRILLDNKMQVDFVIVNEDEFGPMVLEQTGSKWFNITCRKMAKDKGFKLNGYGLWKNDLRIANTEISILQHIGIANRFTDPKERSL